MNNSILGIIIALISTMSWAICTVLLKKLGEKLEPIAMTAFKALLASLILFIIIYFTGTKINIGIENIVPIAISGILGIAIGDSLFFASLNRLSPLILSLMLFVGPDIFSGIFGLIFLKEMPSILSWVGIFGILAGLSFLIFPLENDKSQSKTKITGIIFAILSLICTSYSMVIIKPVLGNVPVITATMYRMIFSAVILIILGLFSKKILNWKEVLSDGRYSLKLTATFALATIGGFWLSLIAIKYCKLIIASSLMSLEPLFILIFMIVFNRYIPKIKEIIGIIIIVLGIIFICLG